MFLWSKHTPSDSIQNAIRDLGVSDDLSAWLVTPNGNRKSLDTATAKKFLKALQNAEGIQLSHPNFVDQPFEIRIHTKTEHVFVNVFFKEDDENAYVFVFLGRQKVSAIYF